MHLALEMSQVVSFSCVSFFFSPVLLDRCFDFRSPFFFLIIMSHCKVLLNVILFTYILTCELFLEYIFLFFKVTLFIFREICHHYGFYPSFNGELQIWDIKVIFTSTSHFSFQVDLNVLFQWERRKFEISYNFLSLISTICHQKM